MNIELVPEMNFKCFLEYRLSLSDGISIHRFQTIPSFHSLLLQRKNSTFQRLERCEGITNARTTRNDRRVWREISRSIKKIEEVFEGNSCVRGTLSANFNGRRGYRGAMTTERRLAVMGCARVCMCVCCVRVCVATTYVSTPFHDRARPLSPVCGHVQISR